jgi:FKBP-type peptidyl-prolyl cis-trans isomerase
MRAWNLLSDRLLNVRTGTLGVSFVAIGLALVTSGCGDPMIVPVVMPGSKPVLEISEADAAEALGEQGAQGGVQVPSTQVDTGIFPAQPTNPGETRTLSSNIQYLTLQPGTGPEAKPGQTAVVHYIGMLPNGSTFDSSRDRGKPLKFVIGAGDVIRGWDLGVTGMLVGETRRLRIPPELAYGAQGSPPVIPPNATLVFEVELLELQ